MAREQLARWSNALGHLRTSENRWRDDRGALVEAVQDAALAYSEIPYVERCLVKKVRWPCLWGPVGFWVKCAPSGAEQRPAIYRAAEAYLLTLDVIAPRLRRNFRKWGVMRLCDLPTGGFFSRYLAVYLLRSRNPPPSVTAGGMVVFPGAPSILARRATKVLVALDSVPVADLALWLKDDKGLDHLGASQVDSILRLHEHFDVRDGDIVLKSGVRRLADLTEAERLALRILRDRGGVVDREHYLYVMRTEGGVQMPLASAVLRSPFLQRVERGVYALRGRTIEPAEAQAVKDQANASYRDALLRFEHDDAHARCRYALGVLSLQRGSVPLPASVQFDRAAWVAEFPDGSVQNVWIRAESLCGLRPWMERIGRRPGVEITVEFLFSEGVVRVTRDR